MLVDGSEELADQRGHGFLRLLVRLEGQVTLGNVADVSHKLLLIAFLPVDHCDGLVRRNGAPVTRNGFYQSVIRYASVSWRFNAVVPSWITENHVDHGFASDSSAIFSLPVSNAEEVIHLNCEIVCSTESNQVLFVRALA